MSDTKFKRYSIKEVFGPTIQGEAAMAGTPVRFVRFAGCNMWDGRPETRADSQCPYCDTDFYHGTLMTAPEIAQALQAIRGSRSPWVWISGGEPMLQVDLHLVKYLGDWGYMCGIETNGTVFIEPVLESHLKHVVCSPKVPFKDLRIRRADVLKVLFPHPNPEITPEKMQGFEASARYLQPIDTMTEEGNKRNLDLTIAKLHELRGWRLSLQTHKILGVA